MRGKVLEDSMGKLRGRKIGIRRRMKRKIRRRRKLWNKIRKRGNIKGEGSESSWKNRRIKH